MTGSPTDHLDTAEPAGSAVQVPRRPPPDLRPWVREYVGYRMTGFPSGTHLGLPSPDLTVVLPLDGPLEFLQMADPGQSPGFLGETASGLTDRPVVMRHPGHQEGVQLALTPAGCRALLGRPTAVLGASVVPLGAVLPGADELMGRLAETPTWAGRFAAVDEVLRRAVRWSYRPMSTPLATAFALLTSSSGWSVQCVAAEIGWSRRHLSGRFAAEFSISPGDAGRIARFDRSRRLIRTGTRTLAEVAADAGYYDQAHLAREWRRLAGRAPSVWQREELFPIVQAAAAVDGHDG
ncbi:helix-turn-helix domain-containing protein [Nakamurella flava]|nr:AraC family transcriptional regulator [Nakamurella flava]